MTSPTDKTPDTASETTARAASQDGASSPIEQSTDSHNSATETNSQHAEKKKEIGGRGGLDPARYGDWEINGRCYDF